MVLQGERFVDIYCPTQKRLASFQGVLYCNQPAMVVWPAGIFHRIISGSEGSISINFATRNKLFNLKDNFNIYDLNSHGDRGVQGDPRRFVGSTGFFVPKKDTHRSNLVFGVLLVSK